MMTKPKRVMTESVGRIYPERQVYPRRKALLCRAYMHAIKADERRSQAMDYIHVSNYALHTALSFDGLFITAGFALEVNQIV